MEGRFLLNVVIRKGAAIFQLLAGEDQTLLVWGNAFFVLDFSLDVLDGIWWLNFQSDGFAGVKVAQLVNQADERTHLGNVGWFGKLGDGVDFRRVAFDPGSADDVASELDLGGRESEFLFAESDVVLPACLQ